MKIIKNKSNNFDATHIASLVEGENFSPSSTTTNVLLYGDYIVNDDGIGRFTKYFVFSGELGKCNALVPVATNKTRFERFLSLEYQNGKFHQIQSTPRDSFNWISPFLLQRVGNSDGQFFTLRNETCFISDLRMFVPMNFAKLRQIKFCKNCETHFKRQCSCLGKSVASGYSPSDLYFVDVDNGTDLQSKTSLNKSIYGYMEQPKTFLGFEWELGFEKENLSTNEIAQSFYRHIKNKNIDLYNLFGDNMEDSSIMSFYSKGSEIGSNVMSFDYYKKYATQIEEISEFANDQEIFGSNLGFHINISRDSFQSASQIINFLTLAFSSVEILVKLSGRRDGGSNMNSYCPIVIPSEYRHTKMEDVNRGLTSQNMIKKLAHNVFVNREIGGKMQWFAFHKSFAIEYRLPASSTDSKNGVFSKTCRHLEMVFALVEYSKQHVLKDMRFDKFLEWMEKQDVFINVYNSIVSNEDVMELIEDSTMFAKQLNISTPKLDVDFEDEFNTDKMQSDFDTFIEQVKSAKKIDDSTKEIKNKHNKNIKQRKKREEK
tara:strand:+ start:1129 stop:2760 length:1632 start_codon:yes stop_codon:yes gene_type:complete